MNFLLSEKYLKMESVEFSKFNKNHPGYGLGNDLMDAQFKRYFRAGLRIGYAAAILATRKRAKRERGK